LVAIGQQSDVRAWVQPDGSAAFQRYDTLNELRELDQGQGRFWKFGESCVRGHKAA
jgi:hypothetical protein